MNNIKNNQRIRYAALKLLPARLVGFIVFLKGGGISKLPKKVTPSNPDSLMATITYNEFGVFCTPDSCLEDEPVQATYRGQQYEPVTMSYIQELNLEGDIIHAGAYFGDSLPALSLAMKNGSKVIAFEPNPESFRCAEITILLNKLSNVELKNMGLSDRMQTVDFQILREGSKVKSGGTARIVESKSERTIEVQCDMIDNIVEPARKIAIIHLDVEGHEAQVIKGATDTIRKNKPLIIIESREETELIMKEIGYKFVRGLEERRWENGYRNAVYASE